MTENTLLHHVRTHNNEYRDCPFLQMSEEAQNTADASEPEYEQVQETQEDGPDDTTADSKDDNKAATGNPTHDDGEDENAEEDEEEEEGEDPEYEEEEESEESEEEEEPKKEKKKKSQWYDNLDKDQQLAEINKWVSGTGVSVPLKKFCWTETRGQTRALKKSRLEAIVNSVKANGILKHPTCQVLSKKGMCVRDHKMQIP